MPKIEIIKNNRTKNIYYFQIYINGWSIDETDFKNTVFYRKRDAEKAIKENIVAFTILANSLKYKPQLETDVPDELGMLLRKTSARSNKKIFYNFSKEKA
jgi:hypothetical protein|tara:strand:+ start:416 stop:715 length:300 start_codon:yes stop_codon:yes gene_type:complete